MLPADPVGRCNEVFDEKTPPQGSLKEKGSTAMWAGVLGWVSTSSSRRGYILSGDSVLEVSLISN
jgi:hypothetical protein